MMMGVFLQKKYFFSEGDEQREVDQNKAHVLKIFEHIGKQTNDKIIDE